MLWGSAYPCIKIGYNLLGITSNDTASQILFAGVRFTLTGVLTILIFSIINKRFLIPHKKSWVNIGKLGLVQTIVQYLFFYIGLSNTTAAKSSIIGGISPFVAIMIACFMYKQEKFTKSKLFGSLFGFAGIIVINMDFIKLKTSMTLTGEGFILISSVASAMSSSMIKNYSEQENPVVLSGYQFLLGGAIMTAVGFIMGGTLNLINKNAILILLYLALLSAIAYSLWSILLKYNSVSKVTIFGFMIPIFGVILSAMLLKESKEALNLQSLLSLLMVCLGIIIINKFQSVAPTDVTD
jgi:drug/metabolite transporter (DMT)-like permease